MGWLIAILGQIFPYERAAAWIPPIVGSLTLIPTYLLGRKFLGVVPALLACAFVAYLPTEFLHRSLLGFTDHHVLEAFFAVWSVYLMIKAYETHGKWYWVVLTGISFGLYQLSWAGAAFFLLAVTIWVWYEFLFTVRKGGDPLILVRTVSIPVGISVLMSFAFQERVSLLLSVAVVCLPIGLWLLSKFTRDWDKMLFVLTLAAPTAVVVVSIFVNISGYILPLFWGGDSLIAEAHFPTLQVILSSYGLTFFFGIAGLVFIPKTRGKSLFLMWSAVLIVAALGQRRWGYYAAIPLSLMASFMVFYTHRWINRNARLATTVVLIAFLLSTNFTNTARLIATPINYDGYWHQALTWLRNNSEEPFDAPNSYLAEDPGPLKYGVLTWWDYGNWVIRTGRRVPVSSPTQSSDLPSFVFVAESEEAALKLLEKENIRYIVLHQEMLEGKWYAIAIWGQRPGISPQDCYITTLWENRAEAYQEVYGIGPIKIFERTNS
jgi:dolichyl-diphosphooligosaccharide--protein glycosyltransferase